jgi:4-hydroxy-tetrahydrodipicolinate reductase
VTSHRVLFSGAAGRMGRVLVPALAAAEGVELVAEAEIEDDLGALIRERQAECVVDFTTPEAAMPNALTIVRSGAQGIIGTTGFTPEDLDALDREACACGRGVLVAPNFALGMVLLQRFAEEAAPHFRRIEIVEAHHTGKKDAPSGTALETARRLAAAAGRTEGPGDEPSRGLAVDGVRIHSLRLPAVVAAQEVHFGGAGETLTLRHDASSRDCYLPGVLAAIRAMPGRIGLIRGLGSLLFG